MMRLPEFRWMAPTDAAEAVSVLAGDPDARPIAGGTDLVPNMKRRHQVPQTLVSLRGIPGLRGIGLDGAAPGGADAPATAAGEVRIGALTTLTDIVENPALRASHPGVVEAVRSISSPVLRNMGTIGGNLCLDTRCTYYNQNAEWREAIDWCMKAEGEICWVAPGSPRCWAVSSTDAAPLLIAIGARVRVTGSGGEREMPVADLYADDGIEYLTLERGDLVTEVILPAANGWSSTYHKLRRRGSIDFPVLGVGAWVRWADGRGPAAGGSDEVAEARIAMSGVGSRPVTPDGVADLLAGRRLDDDAIAEAADRAFKPSKPMDNTDFVLSWRKKMTRVWVTRALRALRGDAPEA